MKIFSTIVIAATTALLLCVTTPRVLTQTILWDSTQREIEIGAKLMMLEDPKGELGILNVMSHEIDTKFEQSPALHLNLGYNEYFYWLKFSVANTTIDDAVLVLAQAGLPVADLYYKDDGGKLIHHKAGYTIPIGEKVYKNSFQAFPLPAGTHDYYVRLNSNSEPIPVRIQSAAQYDFSANRQKMVYGFYLGLMAFVMLSNLFFFFSLRNGMYLFYSGIVVLYASYAAAVVDGFMVYFFPGVDLMFWYTTIPTIGVTIQTIYCLFFLEVHKYSPRLSRVTWGIVIYFAAWAVAKFFFSFAIVQPINTVNALLSFFMMGFIGMKVGKRGNHLGYYFASAYFVYFLLVLTQATYITTGYPPYFSDLSFVAIATIVEAFVLSFLLSKRFEWEKQEMEKERSAARQLVLEKTLENERIVREQNVELELKVAERTHLLQIEKQKAEDLLHNILPEEVAEELKRSGVSTARLYNNVTVMFTDFVNFTGISEKLSPTQLVEEIDRCYRAFDEIIERNGLEKIKTIGDAYMAACGLPVEHPNHALMTTNAACEILDYIKANILLGGKFETRIGLCSGSVVAGIVGKKKFAYDIWGDTVNLASRMQESGAAGRVNVSVTTYELIKASFNCTYRGKIEAKHKGEIDMYFVERQVTDRGKLYVN